MIADHHGRPDPQAPQRHLRLVPAPDPVPLDLPVAPALSFVNVDELVAQLLSDGFVDGAPPEFAEEVDRGVCGVLHCGTCGREGLEYRPFVSPRMQASAAPGAYRPIAFCVWCQLGAEF